MVVITMPSTLSLITKMHQDFPNIRFAPGDSFRWSPQEHAIYYSNSTDAVLLIHEVAHAALGHDTYIKDIDLLKIERGAWEYARDILAARYEVEINDDLIQDALDTYRNWLHARSTCPDCQATGLQTAERAYTCLACKAIWRVNEARSCGLRRYILS
jgi:hypothetical protein